MAFKCENSFIPNFCLNYVTAYINNFEYVSQGLLNIINTNLLADIDSSFPDDITDDDCVCLPICSEVEPEGCVDVAQTNVFDCSVWDIIKAKLLLVTNESEVEVDQGLLPVLCQTIQCVLHNTPNINHGFAAQLERFLCLCQSLETRIDSVCCNSKCPDLIGDLLCLLMQILTKLISSVSKVALLVQYSDPEGCTVEQSKVIATFFECMVCDFVNDLADLENFIPELSSIVVGFATCDMQMCTPCYTAKSTPAKVRPLCPISNPVMGYGGSKGSCPCKR